MIVDLFILVLQNDYNQCSHIDVAEPLLAEYDSEFGIQIKGELNRPMHYVFRN